MTVTRQVWGFIERRDHRVMRRMNRWRAPRWIRYWMLAATRMGDGWLWYSLAFVLLVVLCFLAGLAAKTAFARKYVDTVEKSVLVKVPGYDAAKSQFLGKLQSKEGDSASASHEP